MVPDVVVKVTRTRVCDTCGSEHGVCRYRITKLEGVQSQTTVTADVCDENPHTLEEIIGAAPAPRRGRKSARPVVSVDEIAAKKAAPARKRATKKATTRKS